MLWFIVSKNKKLSADFRWAVTRETSVHQAEVECKQLSQYKYLLINKVNVSTFVASILSLWTSEYLLNSPKQDNVINLTQRQITRSINVKCLIIMRSLILLYKMYLDIMLSFKKLTYYMYDVGGTNISSILDNSKWFWAFWFCYHALD